MITLVELWYKGSDNHTYKADYYVIKDIVGIMCIFSAGKDQIKAEV